MVRSRVLLCAAVAGLAVALAGCEPTTVYPTGGYVAPFYAGGYYGAPYYGGGYYGGGYGYGSGYGYGGGYRTGYYGGGVYHGGVYRGGVYRRAGYYRGGYGHGGYRGGYAAVITAASGGARPIRNAVGRRDGVLRQLRWGRRRIGRTERTPVLPDGLLAPDGAWSAGADGSWIAEWSVRTWINRALLSAPHPRKTRQPRAAGSVCHHSGARALIASWLIRPFCIISIGRRSRRRSG